MERKREKVFETNSSSTHSLVFVTNNDKYTSPSNKIVIQFADTDSDTTYVTLKEKVSYLVSHIIRKYMYDSPDYYDLIEQVENDYDFRRLQRYVMEHFHKEICFPKSYKGDIDEIVNINHQLVENNLDDVLSDIINEDRNYLEEVLSPNAIIRLGSD